MYESYYGLEAKPFQLRPDPRYFYNSKGHRRAMAYLDYGLEQGEGFIVITGEVGAGKTTLLRGLFERLPAGQVNAAQIVNTGLDADDMLRMVSASFGLPFEGLSKASLLTQIEAMLRHVDSQGRRSLLAVDEAQNLEPPALEALRMLSNIQTSDKALLQTFLLGQPEFRATLTAPRMEQLRQRVSATYHLGPIDAADTRAYIEHRLRTAGWKGIPAITEDAFLAIHEASGGIPRRINTLCERMLLLGYLEQVQCFDETHVATVLDDLVDEADSGIALATLDGVKSMLNRGSARRATEQP
jgi:general secretion pathway protein A